MEEGLDAEGRTNPNKISRFSTNDSDLMCFDNECIAIRRAPSLRPPADAVGQDSCLTAVTVSVYALPAIGGVE